MRNLLILFVFSLLSLSAIAASSPPVPLDLPYRYAYNNVTYTLNEDGSSIENHEWAMNILKPKAVEWAKEASITYSTSVQKAEIIEAYTRKADGKRIDVSRDSYQVKINKGSDANTPVFSDYTTTSLIFPDVAVGDTVVLSYRIIQKEAIFPGYFSLSGSFSKEYAVEDAHVKIIYPSSLWVQYQARGMKALDVLEKDGKKQLEWVYSNPQPVQDKRHNYSVYDPDQETGFEFSNFKNYADIASAYGKRALPKAAVTERIQKLADEIVAGKKDPKEKAQALYEWVATKITYGGNCIGVGAVVPRDIDFVLDNKMGDCKDHATLLQALLASQGIQSMQALVNAGSVYKLPKIPLVSNVNHVINYIPSLDLYVDSTSDSTPFGKLPHQDRGKPVLLVDQYKEGTKTPAKDVFEQKIRSILKIDAEGSISGSVESFQKGDIAVSNREWARNLSKETEQDLIKNMFRAMGINGNGSLIKDDPTALIDTYHYKANITHAEKFLKLPGSGAFYIYPIIGGNSSIMSAIPSALEEEEKVEIRCSGGILQEEYEIELPKNMKVLSIPENMKQSNSHQTYEASYTLKKNKLMVKRSFIDKTVGPICSPEMVDEEKNLAKKVSENLKSQVLYK